LSARSIRFRADLAYAAFLVPFNPQAKSRPSPASLTDNRNVGAPTTARSQKKRKVSEGMLDEEETPMKTSVSSGKIVGCKTSPPKAKTLEPKLDIKCSGLSGDVYSRYKGRGRYAQDKLWVLLLRCSRPALTQPCSGPDITINAQYQIDPSRNEGSNFPFHTVERQPSARKRMHGGDCECCRDVSATIACFLSASKLSMYNSITRASASYPCALGHRSGALPRLAMLCAIQRCNVPRR
jgi:hypothetical protein